MYYQNGVRLMSARSDLPQNLPQNLPQMMVEIVMFLVHR
jgi:hypothetical protein